MSMRNELAAALRKVLDEHDHGALGGRLLEEALADAALTTLSGPADPDLIREARTLATRKIEDSADGEAVQIMLGLICDELEVAGAAPPGPLRIKFDGGRGAMLDEHDRIVGYFPEGLRAAAPADGEKVRQMVRDLIDPDDCWFDHHGGCQAHGYLTLQLGELCPHMEAKQWLSNLLPAGENVGH